MTSRLALAGEPLPTVGHARAYVCGPTVWRPAPAGEAAWPSPWGDGRPGRHAECAAMALSVLGSAVDLHVGGADLRHPHHTAMGAMAEAMTGVRPVMLL